MGFYPQLLLGDWSGSGSDAIAMWESSGRSVAEVGGGAEAIAIAPSGRVKLPGLVTSHLSDPVRMGCKPRQRVGE